MTYKLGENSLKIALEGVTEALMKKIGWNSGVAINGARNGMGMDSFRFGGAGWFWNVESKPSK